MACKQAAMSWIFNGAGSFKKLPVQEDGPRTCHSERSEDSQNECAEAKHIKIQDFSYLTTFHCNSIFALLLSFPKSLNFLISPQTLPVSHPERKRTVGRRPKGLKLKDIIKHKGESFKTKPLLFRMQPTIALSIHDIHTITPQR